MERSLAWLLILGAVIGGVLVAANAGDETQGGRCLAVFPVKQFVVFANLCTREAVRVRLRDLPEG